MIYRKTASGIDMVATGKRISQLMNKSGLTDKQLSGIMGVTVQAINKWRHGYSLPDIENLYILSRILGKRVDDFLIPQMLYEIEIDVVAASSAVASIHRLGEYYLGFKKIGLYSR